MTTNDILKLQQDLDNSAMPEGIVEEITIETSHNADGSARLWVTSRYRNEKGRIRKTTSVFPLYP